MVIEVREHLRRVPGRAAKQSHGPEEGVTRLVSWTFGGYRRR